MTFKDICYIGLNLCSLYLVFWVCKHIIYPKIIDYTTTEIERNPNWLMSHLRSNYYGFDDIDIILCECPICHVPRFRVPKDSDRLELFVPNDLTTWSRDKIAKIALLGKIRIRYGITAPADKAIFWFSILCYLLDGGDINISEVKWEEKDNNSEKRQENS